MDDRVLFLTLLERNNVVPKKDRESKAQWVQQSQTTEKVKVYQNNDPTSDNWVEIERTTGLVMRDKNTGQTWVWRRNG